jgi:hypothetical protein
MAIVHSAGLRKWARRSLLIAALVAAPAAILKSFRNRPRTGTLLGNYLSGRMARGDHDTIAAADFYSKALAGDPGNEIILEQTFLLEAASAHWDRAIQLAQDLVRSNRPMDRPIPPRLRGLQARQLQGGRRAFRRGARGPIADLTSTLARAWVQRPPASRTRPSPPSTV